MCEENHKCDCECECDGHCEEQGHQDGCCCHQTPLQRAYPTRQEQVTALETYLDEMKAEIKAVEARLADLKS